MKSLNVRWPWLGACVVALLATWVRGLDPVGRSVSGTRAFGPRSSQAGEREPAAVRALERAKAHFRAGEALRAVGDRSAARRAFVAALEADPKGPYAERALLEMGHLERRASRWTQARREYSRCLKRSGSSPGGRDEASFWSLRCTLEQKGGRRAVQRWRELAQSAETDRWRIRCYDSWALALIDRGDPAGAAGVLHACQLRHRKLGLEQTERGERVRRTLRLMRAAARLRTYVSERVGELQFTRKR